MKHLALSWRCLQTAGPAGRKYGNCCRIPLYTNLQMVFVPCWNGPVTLLVGIACLIDGSGYRHVAELIYGSILVVIARSCLCMASKLKVKGRIHHYDSSKRARLTWKNQPDFSRWGKKWLRILWKINYIQWERTGFLSSPGQKHQSLSCSLPKFSWMVKTGTEIGCTKCNGPSVIRHALSITSLSYVEKLGFMRLFLQ